MSSGSERETLKDSVGIMQPSDHSVNWNASDYTKLLCVRVCVCVS